MSLIRRILDIWAETGDKDPKFEPGKHASGWVGGDKPYIEGLNYLQNRVEEKINDLAVEGVSSAYDGATAAQVQSMLMTGQWDESWGVTNDENNTISGGATKEYTDMGLWFDADGGPQLLVMDEGLTKIEVWDARLKTLTDTSHDLSTDIIAGTWTAESMCTDGTYVYVTFYNGSTVHHLHAWKISDWSVHTGWAATGTVLPGTGPVVGGDKKLITVANSAYLVTMNPWNSVTSASSAAISIINIATGVITASGAGDAPTADSAYTSGGICSDGTYVFFGATGSTSQYLCSASISSPATGCGGTGYPKTLAANVEISTLVQCGPTMFVSLQYDSSGPSYLDTVLETHTASNVTGDYLTLGRNTSTPQYDGSTYVLYQAFSAVFDGINIWIWGCIDNLASTAKSGVLVKLDTGKLLQNDADETRQLSDLADVFMLPPDVDIRVNQNAGVVVFDGRDIWVNPEYRPSVTLSGKIHRLPLALLRS